MTQQQTENHTVYSALDATGEPVRRTLTGEQEALREGFKADLAGWLLIQTYQVTVALRAAGLTFVESEETMWDAVEELVENGLSDYR